MKINAIKTRKFLPPKDDLWDLLSVIKDLEENSIVAVTSKVVAISEGRCVPLDSIERDELAAKEADLYLPREYVPGSWQLHTIKNNTQVASGGIDKSNSDGYWTLWPKDANKSAYKVWRYLKKKFKLKNLGVLITDSHTIPLRRGLIGFSLGYFGFVPLYDYRGKKDIFGKELFVSQRNVADSLASIAVFAMGEGGEQTPLAIISDLGESVKFIHRRWNPKKPYSQFVVPMNEDLFSPFLKSVPWKKGKGGK